MSGALKTMFVFSLRQDPCRNRSYASGGARYLHADLMLLTHAGCAFKDPHGCFGISGPGAPRRLYGAGQGNEIRKTSFGRGTVFSAASPAQGGRLVQFRTAALRRNRQCGAAAPLSFAGAGCRRGCGPVDAGDLLTCTGRPDGSGARSGRLQLPGCERTAPSHGRGMHESGGCNGSRLPAVPDTSRCPQPWRSG